jgi:tRNA A-37 threonylcarbamoyl transferase component Bud32
MSHTVSIAPPFDAGSPGQLVHSCVGTFRWSVLAQYADCLFAPTAPDWLRLEGDHRATCVKRNAIRNVHRVQLDGRTFFAKTYRPLTPADKIKQLFRGPACRKEWRIVRYANECGIDTIRTVAYGFTAPRGLTGPSVLISEEIKNALPLNEVWQQLLAERDGHTFKARADAIIEAIARLIAHAHQCGFEHSDMHVGNLLVQQQGSCKPRVLFVDLHNARIGRVVHDEAVVRNLAQLNQWFRRHSSAAQRLRFLHKYMAFRRDFSGISPFACQIRMDLCQLTSALHRSAVRHGCKLSAKRDRRVGRIGKYFTTVRLPGRYRGIALRQSKHTRPDSPASTVFLDPSLWRNWLGDPAALFERVSRESLLKDSHSAMVIRSRLPLPGGATLDVICKRVVPRNGFKRLWYAVRPSRAVRSFIMGHALLHRHLPAPIPFLAVEKRWGWLRSDALLITECIPDAAALDEFLRRTISPLDCCGRHQAMRSLIGALAGLFKHLTQQNFAHRDFKAGNVLVRWPAVPAGNPSLYLIDHDGLRLRRTFKPDDVSRMLMRLSLSLEGISAVTRTDRLRFLQSILRGYGKTDANWKPVWLEIQMLADAKRERKRRRTEWKVRHYGRV